MIDKVLAGLGAACAAAGLGVVAGGAARAHARPETTELIARAAQAHEHLMRGDIAGYRRTVELTPDFTLMDPFGGQPSGSPASDEQWHRIGRFFREGRDATLEPIAVYASDGMVVIVGFERAHVAVGALPAQEWGLRVTLVFRRDDGIWRLAHRHADPLAAGISVAHAARITLRESPEAVE